MKTIEQKANTHDGIFPERVVSKNDEIKQRIIKLIKMSHEVGGFALHKWEADEMLDWLEKQCKQNNKFSVTEELYEHIRNAYSCIEDTMTCDNTKDMKDYLSQANYDTKCALDMIKKQDDNKTMTKFSEGDFIVYKDTLFQIEHIDKNGYNVTNVKCGTKAIIPYFFENEMHLWSIEEAKDGDVLYCESAGIKYIVMSKGINEFGHIDSYFRYNSLAGFGINIPSVFNARHNDNITPATKEQRDFLFQKMREAGYEWDANKKELKKINSCSNCDNIKGCVTCVDGDQWEHTKDCDQNNTWSEEDEHRLKDTIYFLDTAKKHYASTVELDACIEWLKSLKQQRIGGN